MIKLIFHVIVNVLVVWLLAGFLPNFSVSGIWPIFWFLLVLTLLNWTIVPIIKFLTLPLNFITFGLFYLIINVVVVWVTANSTSGIEITGTALEKYLVAILISLCLAIVNSLVNFFHKYF